MAAFREVLSGVWATAREDGGALLAEFGALRSDGARAARALQLPQVRALLQRAAPSPSPSFAGDRAAGGSGRRKGKDATLAARAIREAGEVAAMGRDLLAVHALTRAIRLLPPTSELLPGALEHRAEALLRLEEAAAALQDIRRVQRALEGNPPTTNYRNHFDRILRVRVASSRCLEVLGDWQGADAALREALLLVRDQDADSDSPDKAAQEQVADIVGRLKRIATRTSSKESKECNTLPDKVCIPSRVQSGLEAVPRLQQQLLGGPHATLPAACAALEERVDADRGRHLVAGCDIPAGSVLVVERPFAWSLSPADLSTHCLHCCAPVLAPVPCPHCSNAQFCGEACVEAALPAYHLAECPVLLELLPLQLQLPGVRAEADADSGGALSAMALLAYRVVVQAADVSAQIAASGATGSDASGTIRLPPAFVELFQGEAVKTKNKGKKARDCTLPGYGPVFSQLTHSDRRTPADLLKRAVTASYLLGCLLSSLSHHGLRLADQEGDGAVLATAFLRHLQSCSCNAYQVSEHRTDGDSVREAEGAEVGGAVYPTVSLMNHACDPNVARHSHGNVCVVRAITRIRKGCELLDNYGPNFLEQHAQERRLDLQKQYFFRCQCSACEQRWPTLPDLARAPVKYRSKKKREVTEAAARLSELSADMAAGVQGLLQVRPRARVQEAGDAVERAERAALRFGTLLDEARVPPSMDRAKVAQVLSLCWSLQGNRTSNYSSLSLI